MVRRHGWQLPAHTLQVRFFRQTSLVDIMRGGVYPIFGAIENILPVFHARDLEHWLRTRLHMMHRILLVVSCVLFVLLAEDNHPDGLQKQAECTLYFCVPLRAICSSHFRCH